MLAVGLAVMLLTNALLLRRQPGPAGPGDPDDGGRRPARARATCSEDGRGPVRRLVRSFNAMLDRLEAERGASNAQALAAQEAERHRIAQELHDEVGQSLTVVLLGLKQVEPRAPADLVAELALVRESARASLDDVRRVARRLRRACWTTSAWLSALAALATDFAPHSGVPVRRSSPPACRRCPPEAELVVYRVAQEALTNAARHADATQRRAVAGRHGRPVVLEVSDDGRGFGEVGRAPACAGMRERAALVGGRLTSPARRAAAPTVRLASRCPAP